MKRKKKRNAKSSVKPFSSERKVYVLNPEEVLEVMEKGTDVSCKLVDVLIHSGEGIIGMSAAVFGLAKATVLVKELLIRKGYDMTSIYDDVKAFFEDYAETEECEECFKRHGL